MNFLDIFRRRQDASTVFDFDIFEDNVNAAYIKAIALETVNNFVARSLAQSDFRVYKGDRIDKSLVSYKLNVRPNANQSSTTFWRDLVYRLIKDNEALSTGVNIYQGQVTNQGLASSHDLDYKEILNVIE